MTESSANGTERNRVRRAFEARARADEGARRRVATGLRSLLGVVFLAVGGAKLAGADEQVRSFERWGYPQWFRSVTGSVEVAGGLGLLVGGRRPGAGLLGGGLVLGTMLGALYSHLIRVRDPPGEAAPPAVLLTLASVVTADLVGRLRSRTGGAGREGTDD